jgi:TfoX/Sxy family transcriptional regulator of competence genes
MAYNEELAARVRTYFDGKKNTEEKKMFGGVCFMLDDKMCVGVSKDHLMVRFDPEMQEEIMERRGARPMEFTKRVMRGYVFVDPETITTKKELDYWVNLAIEYNPRAQSSKKKTAAKKSANVSRKSTAKKPVKMVVPKTAKKLVKKAATR